MATTPILALRYPLDPDTPVVGHTAIQNLAQDFDGFFGAWTGWTPQIDQGATTNIAKTVDVACYRLIGKFCEFEFRCTMLGMGTVSAKVTWTLPQTSKSVGYMPVAWGGIKDVSATSNYVRSGFVDNGSQTRGVFWAASGLLGAAIFTAALAAGDIVYANGFMEVL